MDTLRTIAGRSKTAIIAFRLFDNWRVKRRFQAGDASSDLGSTHSRFTLEESIDYIDDQFADYVSYGNLSIGGLEGKRILELGFGDNLGVALSFLVSGAAHVTCVDKFYSTYDPSQQLAIYRALRARLGPEGQRRFDMAIDVSNTIEPLEANLSCIYGRDIESCDDILQPESFDVIISRAVIQDIFDPLPAFIAMNRLLSPGGLMLHKIDLSDQGMFRDKGMHPLTFLTIPDSIYRLMAMDSGRSNRKLIGDYRRTIESLGYTSKIWITSLIGQNGKGNLLKQLEFDASSDEGQRAVKLIEEIQSRLTHRFRILPNAELAVDGIFLVAEKPLQNESAAPGESGSCRERCSGENQGNVWNNRFHQ